MKHPTSPACLSTPELLSKRHTISMYLLASAAGAVNAGALAVCERFVTHVTGTLTQIGVDAGQWPLMLEYALVFASFVLGAVTSVLPIQGRVMRGLRPLAWLPLLGTAGILVAVAVLGSAGVFGAAGGQVEEVPDFAFLSVVAFAMGLMNAGVASSTALAVRTTHMTGPASDFGVSLATAWLSQGEMRREQLKVAWLRGGKAASFVVGAALMFPLVRRLGFAAFALPAGAILYAMLRSFVPAVSTAGLLRASTHLTRKEGS